VSLFKFCIDVSGRCPRHFFVSKDAFFVIPLSVPLEFAAQFEQVKSFLVETAKITALRSLNLRSLRLPLGLAFSGSLPQSTHSIAG